jgi:histidyl-tRNA synthetase
MTLVAELRDAGLRVDLDLTGRKIANQFKMADREGAKACVILGDAELAGGTAQVKVLGTGQQTSVARSDLVAHLKSIG